jgi:glycosyltransferase involved in cell wall biosynthesis
MVQGTPVLASDIPALREVAGDAARLVPAGDVEAWVEALRGLLGDAAARSRGADAGRARAALFSWERTAAATIAVYREVL